MIGAPTGTFNARARAFAGVTLEDAAVPSGPGFIALLEAFRASGGTAPGEIVGRLLQEHQTGDSVSLARRVYSAEVFGFEWRAALWIPMFQFDAKDLSMKAGPQQVRVALPPVWSGWAVASWFAAPNALLAGRRPVDSLDADLDAVLQAARGLPLVEEFATLQHHWRRAHGNVVHV